MFAANDQIPIMEMHGRWKPHLQQAPNCPRCASTNTKFCYYNNYSLAQPRYFCKACRRYWTKGGSLRNVPVGGGCRKTRRSRSKHPHSSPTTTTIPPYQLATSPEIDMAAVFARYVNQDQPISQPQPPQLQHTNHQQPHCLFQSFDHHFQDVLWSTSTEDGSSLSTSANWPHPELDFDSSSPFATSVLDDQFCASANSLLADFNWACFDHFAGYGDFYTST